MNARHPRGGEVDEGLAPAANAVMMAHGADLVAAVTHGAGVGGGGDGGEGGDGHQSGDQGVLHLGLPRLRGRQTATLSISNHKPQTFFAFPPAPYILSNIWSCLVHPAAKFRLPRRVF